MRVLGRSLAPSLPNHQLRGRGDCDYACRTEKIEGREWRGRGDRLATVREGGATPRGHRAPGRGVPDRRLRIGAWLTAASPGRSSPDQALLPAVGATWCEITESICSLC